MKLTLFTISNEQIKESLDKLQTKVESLETVKELQDKVISMQDHQISFLNDSIANMWAPIGIVAGIAGLVITGAFAYVSILHHQAKRKREEVEQLIQQSHSIATIAQDKINELNEKQLLLQKQTDAIEIKQKLDKIFNYIKNDLDFIRKRQESDRNLCTDEHIEEFREFILSFDEIEQEYIALLAGANNKIISDIDIEDGTLQQVERLKNTLQKVYDEYVSFYVKLRSVNVKN